MTVRKKYLYLNSLNSLNSLKDLNIYEYISVGFTLIPGPMVLVMVMVLT